MDGVGVMTPMGNSCFLEGATCTTRRSDTDQITSVDPNVM